MAVKVETYNLTAELANGCTLRGNFLDYTVEPSLFIVGDRSPGRAAEDEREIARLRREKREAIDTAAKLDKKLADVIKERNEAKETARELTRHLAESDRSRSLWRGSAVAQEKERDEALARVKVLEHELSSAAAWLQINLPVGQVKHIGLREVSEGVKQMADNMRFVRGRLEGILKSLYCDHRTTNDTAHDLRELVEYLPPYPPVKTGESDEE